jgi:uncharacterized membrane protein
MTDPSARTFSSDFKRFFLRGLVILLPSVLTLWIVVKAYQFVDSAIAEPINRGMRAGLTKLIPYWGPADGIVQWWNNHRYMDLIGLIVAVVIVYVTGYLLGGFLGRSFYRKIERIITTLPVFKQVYPYVKQIVDFLFSDDKAMKFNRVVMIEYPRRGIWSIGFQTGNAIAGSEGPAGDAVTVFIPSSPTPFTGYAITVPRDEVIELPITVEEAIRYVVSGGVLAPQRIAAIQEERIELVAVSAEDEFSAVSATIEAVRTRQDLGTKDF